MKIRVIYLAVGTLLLAAPAARAEAIKIVGVAAYDYVDTTRPPFPPHHEPFWQAVDSAPLHEALKVRVIISRRGWCGVRVSFGDGAQWTNQVRALSYIASPFDPGPMGGPGLQAPDWWFPAGPDKIFSSPGTYTITAVGDSAGGYPACIGTASASIRIGPPPTPTPPANAITKLTVPPQLVVGDHAKITVEGRGVCSYTVQVWGGGALEAPPSSSSLSVAARPAAGTGASAVSKDAPVVYKGHTGLPATLPLEAVFRAPGSYTITVVSAECIPGGSFGGTSYPGQIGSTVNVSVRSATDSAVSFSSGAKPTVTPTPKPKAAQVMGTAH